MPSIFSRIIAGEIPCHQVFRGERWLAFLDIAPAAPGHTLLVPLFEAPVLHGLPADTLAELGPLLARLTVAVRRVSTAPDVNAVLNDGPAAGQVVPHVHFHVIPRWPDDGKKLHFGAGATDHAALAEVAGRLRAAWGA